MDCRSSGRSEARTALPLSAAALTGHATERGRSLALEAGFQTYLKEREIDSTPSLCADDDEIGERGSGSGFCVQFDD
jgi:hypothetical protein